MSIDTVGEVLWWSIFATPVISWAIFGKRRDMSHNAKWVYAVALTLFLSLVLFVISMSILLRNGLGPT